MVNVEKLKEGTLLCGMNSGRVYALISVNENGSLRCSAPMEDGIFPIMSPEDMRLLSPQEKIAVEAALREGESFRLPPRQPIKVGQVWRTRDGSIARVIESSDGDVFSFVADVEGSSRWFHASGSWSSTRQTCRLDLVELLEEAPEAEEVVDEEPEAVEESQESSEQTSDVEVGDFFICKSSKNPFKVVRKEKNGDRIRLERVCVDPDEKGHTGDGQRLSSMFEHYRPVSPYEKAFLENHPEHGMKIRPASFPKEPILPGQTWKTRDGRIFEVKESNVDGPYCFRIGLLDATTLAANGRRFYGHISWDDLVLRVDIDSAEKSDPQEEDTALYELSVESDRQPVESVFTQGDSAIEGKDEKPVLAIRSRECRTPGSALYSILCDSLSLHETFEIESGAYAFFSASIDDVPEDYVQATIVVGFMERDGVTKALLHETLTLRPKVLSDSPILDAVAFMRENGNEIKKHVDRARTYYESAVEILKIAEKILTP